MNGTCDGMNFTHLTSWVSTL